MSITVAYPYDASASKGECLISEENHIVVTNDNDYRVIVPEMAPFYKVGLVIRHPESDLLLTEGKDYNLGYRLIDVTLSSHTLYGCIVIINPLLKGEFQVTYQTVGGDFVGIRSEILTYLANALIDPVTTPYSKVLERPTFFTPCSHSQHYSDFTNKEEVETSIDNVVSGIDAYGANKENVAAGDLLDRVSDMNAVLQAARQDLHIKKTNNPHKTTYTQASALGKLENATDTLKAYGKTLVALADYINSRGITQADIDKYLSTSSAQAAKGALVLAEGKAVIRNQTGESTIDLSNGEIKITGEKLLEIFAGDDVYSSGEVLKMLAGKNVLQIQSNGTNGMSETRLTYNGHELINVNNVRATVAAKGGVGMRVVTEDTDTIKWSGTSREDSPLAATMDLPKSTTGTLGTVKLSDDRSSSSTTTTPVPAVLNAIRKDIETLALKTTTINGQPLSSNVNLDAADFDLDRVSNTSDVNKPVSEEQLEVLEGYSPIEHTHDVSEMVLPVATTDEYGVVNLMTSLQQADTLNSAATPSAVEEYADHILTVSTQTGGKLSNDVLDVRYWSPSGDVTASGFVLTFEENAALYMNQINYQDREDAVISGASLDFAALYPDNHTYSTFYVYIIANSDTDIYYEVDTVKLTNSGNRLHIGTVKTNGTTFVNVSLVEDTDEHPYIDNVDGIMSFVSVTSVGMFRELLEHLNDPTAHLDNISTASASQIGLDLIHNYPVANYITDGSHASIAEWEFFVGYDPTLKDSATLLPNTVINNNLSVSNGVTVNLPWSKGGNQQVMAKNVNMTFNDPAQVSTTKIDGLNKRRIAYLLNGERTEGTATIERWYALLGSYTDEAGTLHEVVLQYTDPSNETSRAMSVRYYVDHVATELLTSINNGSWTSAQGYDGVYLIFEYWQTADGFMYAVELQHDEIQSGGSLEMHRTELEVKSDGFDVTNTTTQYVDKARARNITATNNNVSYQNGNVKKAFESGIIGFGGDIDDSFTGADSVTTLQFDVDCIAADEGAQSEKYITAKGVYDSLKNGVNLLVATGTVAVGVPLPTLVNSRYQICHFGWNEMGASGNNTDAIDGIISNLYSMADGSGIVGTKLDMLSVHRHVYHECMFKYESEGGSGASTHEVPLNYMLLGLRDV